MGHSRAGSILCTKILNVTARLREFRLVTSNWHVNGSGPELSNICSPTARKESEEYERNLATSSNRRAENDESTAAY